MTIRPYKYLAVFTLPLTVVVSFTSHGWLTFLPVIYAFALIPIIELLIGKSTSNLDAVQRDIDAKDLLFDFFIYLTVPVQVLFLVWFLFALKQPDLTNSDITGRVLGMGIMCGVFGINIAHELGHRAKKWERAMAKVMLCTSLYMHFYIEHNRGHHRNVGTPLDAATARRNETLYAFWLRTVYFSFISAWQIVKKERTRRELPTWSLRNEMIGYILMEVVVSLLIGFFFGLTILLLFLAAALIGMLLLETVNYIEHYGLFRKKLNAYRYEDVKPVHSWNSDHILGRIVLFELTRHSDHHFEPSRHYQHLDSMEDASQLPAGYPAMMLLSLVPPLWFYVMNPRLVNKNLAQPDSIPSMSSSLQ